MEPIYKNEELLKLTAGTYLIHDASVTRFDIYLANYELCIDVYFESIRKSDKQFKIHFTGITKYQFLYTNNHNFYTVESYKFFMSDQGYYLSLDPFNELDEISDEDEDSILCENIEGSFVTL